MTNRAEKKLQQIKKEINQLSINATCLSTCSKKEQIQWFIDVCKTFKQKPAPQLQDIQLLKIYFKDRADIPKLYQTNADLATKKEGDLLASTAGNTKTNHAISRLTGVFGSKKDWDKFGNKIERKGRKLQSAAAEGERKTNQQKLQGYWDKKYNQAQTLEKLYPHQKDICNILTAANLKDNKENKKERSKNSGNINIVYKTAEKFKANSRNPHSPYTIDNYIFAMQLAKDHPDQDNVAELVRMIREHPKCPKILSDKGLDDTTKPERTWIKKIDAALGIERKQNTGS